MNPVALFEAKNHLTDLVRQAEQGPPVEITRHGKPVAMLMGVEQYRQAIAREQSFGSALARFRTDWAARLQALAATDPVADPFAELRDQTTGREPGL
jgi:prevent-host-death family protein